VDGALLRERLGVWIRAGIIRPEQADLILDLEVGPLVTPGPSFSRSGPSGSGPSEPVDRRSRIAEVVGYVGAAFALGALGLFVSENWADLTVWARILLLGLLTLTALSAGTLLQSRTDAALRRLVGVLWAASVVGVAGTTGVIAWELAGVPEPWMPTVIGSAALVVAAVLLAVGRHVLVQLAALVALGVATTGAVVAIAPLEPGPLAFGALMVGGGATWALAGAGGWLGPRVSAEAAGAVVLLVGAQVLNASGWPQLAQVLAVVLASALVALSVPGGRIHLLYIGAVGLFISVPRLVFDVFADTLGAPATLLTTGVLLIIMAVGLGRVRKAQEVEHG